MSLDVGAANRQINILLQQKKQLSSVIRQLAEYRDCLDAAWGGEEIKYYNKTIDSLESKCRTINSGIESLARDISMAIEDILAEEALGFNF